jgi:DNA (cytosine-5)-methyltransferase 1
VEITYGSVCSGIEAATQGWHPLGMRAAWFAEIEPFPSAVLAHHYPDVPNHGDMTKLAALVLAGKIPAPDVLVGGTPCQAFSVAGMREGLTDPRGALTIKYVELADAVDYVRAGQRKPASVIVWENVPGVLSDKGNAFGCFLGALAGEDCELQPPGKKWQDAGCVYGPKRTIAWRVLDAQYFGLAQRRRRVFVVASARDGFDPTEVLFEREGVRRDTAPRRGQGQEVTRTAPFGPKFQRGPVAALTANGVGTCGADDNQAQAGHLIASGGGANCEQTEVATALSAHPGGTRMDAETETFCVQLAPTMRAGGNSTGGDRPPGTDVDTAESLIATWMRSGASSVRRLTPVECERLQGVTDDYTLIPWRGKPASECPDGPRYKAIGNSKAVTVVRWIGLRLLKQL